MQPPIQVGIDLGGTKIEIIALRAGETLLRQRIATPQGNYQATLTAIEQLVTDAEQQLGTFTSLGIGIPGTVSADHGRVKNANSTCLIGQDLQTDLQQRLKRTVHIANDADCFALSEASDGAGKQARSVFAAILGTGVGAGIVLNGQLLSGPNGIAGEWGHNPLPWRSTADGPSRRCYCGKHDCIETFLSGPGWVARHAPTFSAEQLASSSATEALAAVELYCDQLARALASVINILDPEIIVLGGGMSNIQRLYQRVPELLPKYVFSDQVNTRLVAAQYGDSSGVRGAAWLSQR